MRNIVILLLLFVSINANAQLILSDQPIKNSIEVNTESSGKELSFPVLDTKYNRNNKRKFKHHFWGGESLNKKAEIKTENVSIEFLGLEDFLDLHGYRTLKEMQSVVKKQNLKIYYIKKKSNE